ncbi:MAG: radical SAM protein [Prevotella sp.]|nr:radical SAM protein [Prevotella sp.]
MSTIIYTSPIFGPVHSRRLGVSLGINLMPGDGKICTFDCIYCECGFNADHRPHTPRPTREEVATALERQLQKMRHEGPHPDVLTFAGNGEPTCHPQFADIIADTVALRDRFFPEAKISVLSNGTQLHRQEIREALMLVDNNIQKLDTVDNDYIRRVDRPINPRYDSSDVVEQMAMMKGHVIVQTMFMSGTSHGISVDNTGDAYVLPWIDALLRIQPSQVMIYTIDRETPDHDLRKASPSVLDSIAEQVRAAGLTCSVSY